MLSHNLIRVGVVLSWMLTIAGIFPPIGISSSLVGLALFLSVTLVGIRTLGAESRSFQQEKGRFELWAESVRGAQVTQMKRLEEMETKVSRALADLRTERNRL